MFAFIEAYPKIFAGFEIIIEFERNSDIVVFELITHVNVYSIKK